MGLKRNPVIVVVVLMALKNVWCFAATPLSFPEFKPMPINGSVGSFTASNGVFRLSPSTTNHGIFYLAQPFSGNGQASARVHRPAGSSAKIGVVFRQGTNAVAPFAGMFLDGSNTVFERQSGGGRPVISTVRTNEAWGWLRVVREGSAFGGFYSNDGTNWIQISADTIEMPADIFVGLGILGEGDATFDNVKITSGRLVSPLANQNFVMPTNVLLEAEVVHSGGIRQVEFFSGTRRIVELNSVPYSFLWTNVLGGFHSVIAKITDATGAEFFTEPVNCDVALPAARATFLRVDAATKGNWPGIYGTEGFLLVNDKTNLPASVQWNVASALTHTWNTEADGRGLRRSTGEGRIAAAWTYRHPIEMEIKLADGNERQMALYFLDWDSMGRTITVEIGNAVGKILSEQTVPAFSEGKYLLWRVRGEIFVRIRSMGPGNVVVSGIFFDN